MARIFLSELIRFSFMIQTKYNHFRKVEGMSSKITILHNINYNAVDEIVIFN